MKLFLGEYEHSLDDRGRITLPRKVRQEITGTTIVIARGFDTCVFGYDLSQWEAESAKQLVSPITDRDGRSVRRYLFSSAEKADIDKLGRIVLPTHLKEYAGIGKEITVIGAGDHFELWNTKTWNTYKQTLETNG